jgi:hypothetical protein
MAQVCFLIGMVLKKEGSCGFPSRRFTLGFSASDNLKVIYV